jgi:hypothetical protein
MGVIVVEVILIQGDGQMFSWAGEERPLCSLEDGMQIELCTFKNTFMKR